MRSGKFDISNIPFIDITKYKKFVERDDSSDNELECVWLLGTPCDGKVTVVNMFKPNGLKIPICERHFTEHRVIMTLFKAGVDLESIIEMSSDDRNKEIIRLELVLTSDY